MGTRSGDIDPGVISYLWRRANMSVEEIESMLNQRPGLGLAGERDFRRLQLMVESGDESAQLAYDCSSTGCASTSGPTSQCCGIPM